MFSDESFKYMDLEKVKKTLGITSNVLLDGIREEVLTHGGFFISGGSPAEVNSKIATYAKFTPTEEKPLVFQYDGTFVVIYS